ncbi:hypothetical protein B0H19DRAFT_1273034 [Mycena capillaripes]|nr:hypothetical protein B0H19DRAFT_1273034 [Mycena capillaripes]
MDTVLRWNGFLRALPSGYDPTKPIPASKAAELSFLIASVSARYFYFIIIFSIVTKNFPFTHSFGSEPTDLSLHVHGLYGTSVASSQIVTTLVNLFVLEVQQL